MTAQRREENLQTTPIAITALSADSLNKQGVTDFAGVANASTSLNFTPYPSSSNTLILYMRGQGVADANQITQDGSVGLYEDGFYIARPQAETFDLADVEARRYTLMRLGVDKPCTFAFTGNPSSLLALFEFADRHELAGTGVGWIDVHLLVSAALSRVSL